MSTSIRLKYIESVAVLTIDCPASKVNVLSTGLMEELRQTLLLVAANPFAKGLVIISGKADNFVAGANLEEIVAIQTQPSVVAFDATQKGKEIFQIIADMPFPTVAAINGTCLGGGTELALACKFRVATDSKATRFGLPEVGLGFLPGWGGCVRLPKLIGAQNALALILQPLSTWDANKAWRVGMIDEVVPERFLLERAYNLAIGATPRRAKQPLKARAMVAAMDGNKLGRKVLAKVASGQIYRETKGQFPAPPKALKVVLGALTLPEEEAFELESRLFSELAVTPESRALVGIFFATQESKKSPQNIRPTIAIRKVGVMGGGVMGAGIAQSALKAGYSVVLFDKFQAGIDKGRKSIADLFAELVAKGKMTQAAFDDTMRNLTTTLEMQHLSDCDLVVEAIIEDMGAKKAALAELERIIQKPFIFATNTSSLSVTTMASDAKLPENVGGLHFFNPVHKMPLVEVVAGKQTSAETTAALKAFASKLGKTTVETADSPGFVVNRILAPYLFEAIRLMEQGVPMQDIDDAMKKFGMKMGPLALLDEVGLDIATKVIHVLNDALGDRLTPPAVLDVIQSKKLLGKKGGKGIYVYDANGKPTGFNPELTTTRVETTKPKGLGKLPVIGKKFRKPAKKITHLTGSTETPKTTGEIQDRLVLAVVNEAARCIEEGIVADASQLDLAMIFGTGFPPFRGGVLRHADAVGARTIAWKLSQLAKVSGANYDPAQLLLQKAQGGETFYR